MPLIDLTKPKFTVKKKEKTEPQSAGSTAPVSSARRRTENVRETDGGGSKLLAKTAAVSTENTERDAGRLGGEGRTEVLRLRADREKTASVQKQPDTSGGNPLREHLFRAKNRYALETSETAARTAAKTQKVSDAVAAHGSTKDYMLVKKAAARVDFTDWDKKTTVQQRAALKRSGLSDEEQWTLLNRDNSYIETLSVISKLRDDRADYGLSAAETEKTADELLALAELRANAAGNGQPYLGKLPRAEMVKFLDTQRTELLRSVGYLPADDVGANAGVWYDEGEKTDKGSL